MELDIDMPRYTRRGEKFECYNCRGISLLNIVYKIIAAVINKRLNQYAEELIGEYQNGFRNNRATTDNIFVMRQIFEKSHEYNIELYILYIYFKQAFDTVNRQIMLQRLQETGIPNKLIRLTKMTIQYTRASVVVENLKTDPFDISTGVRQGDPLSATLFNLVLESVIRKLELRSDISSELIQINAYADDIALIARTKKAH
jgi:sorting nexin-29